jgi:O-antigen/teichoic acid export membrane protein
MKQPLPVERAVPVQTAGMLESSAANAPAFSAARLKGWASLLTRFLSLEFAIQAMGFAAGVLLIRALPKAEYAFFTIANTMQQTMNLLADNGISSGLTAIGGRVWDDRTRFGQLISTAMRLRKTLALLVIVVVTPILAWMLTGAGATPSHTALLSAAVLGALYFQLSVGVLIVAPLLHLQVNRVQKLYFWSAALRLAVIAGAYMLFLDAFVALLAGMASYAVQEWLLRRWLAQYIDTAAPINSSDQREIWGIIKDQAPNAIYYCVQSQLMIWLISIFGSTTGVAEVGALGRLGMIFLIAGSVMMNVVLPRFARVQGARLIWRRYWQIMAGFTALNAALLLLTAIYPEAVLWIIGPKYAHLKPELLLMVVGTVLAAIMGTMYQLNVTRGWVVSPRLLIPMGVATDLLLILILDVSQVRGVLLMAAFSTFPGFFLNLWRTAKGVRDTESAAVNGHK